MKTKEVIRNLSISHDTLRHYERLGLIKPKRSDNNYRRYTEEDIQILKLIMKLKGLNFTLIEIKELFSLEEVIESTDNDEIALSNAHNLITRKHDELVVMRQDIEESIQLLSKMTTKLDQAIVGERYDYK